MKTIYKVLQGVNNKLGHGDIDCVLYKGEDYSKAYQVFQDEKENKKGWVHYKGDHLVTWLVRDALDDEGNLLDTYMDDFLIEEYKSNF